MPDNERFSELQDEFSNLKRLRLAQTPEDKLELLNELQRIVKRIQAGFGGHRPQEIEVIWYLS